MSDEWALLKAIQTDPDEELHRLVLADWLDDNDDPQRAEFVRVQCELARGEADKFRTAHLHERERQLLFENADRWLGPFADTDPPVYRYARGTATITLHTMTLLQPASLPLAAEWFPRSWVMDLRLKGPCLNLDVLFEQPWLAQLSALRFDQVSSSILADLVAGCAALSDLRRLAFVESGTPGTLGRLARGETLHCLTSLNLSHSALMTDLVELGRGLPSLRALNLSRIALRVEHIDALLRADWLEQLITLQLADCALPTEGLQRLLASPRLANLNALNLSGNPLMQCDAAILAASPHLTSLRRLGLRNTRIGSQGAAALKRSSLPPLEMLDVWDSRIGRGVDHLRERFGAALWMRLEDPPCWGE